MPISVQTQPKTSLEMSVFVTSSKVSVSSFSSSLGGDVSGMKNINLYCYPEFQKQHTLLYIAQILSIFSNI